jgi:hypothetical protein
MEADWLKDISSLTSVGLDIKRCPSGERRAYSSTARLRSLNRRYECRPARLLDSFVLQGSLEAEATKLRACNG